MSDTGMTPQQEGEQPSAPYEGVLSGIVAKVREQPFLFVIAIAALIIGAVVLGARLGSSDLRFVITVIAVLAVLVIAGYYVREGMNMAARRRKGGRPQEQGRILREQQKIEVAGGAKLDGALQEGSGIGSQVISVQGQGTFAKDLTQTSTGGPSDKEK